MAGKNTLTTIYISSSTHLNLTFNLNQCGDGEIPADGSLRIAADDSFTLVCLHGGAALLECGGLGFPMKGPEGLFAFPDYACELKNNGDAPIRVTWLRFSGYLVENYLNRANISRTHPTFPDEERKVLDRMTRLYAASQKLPNRYCRMASILYDIFSLLLDRDIARGEVHYVDDANFYAVKAAEYIERHYTQSVSVDEIAQAVGISRHRLYVVFNEIMKISPKQYLIYYRIEKAGRRLRLSKQSVQEIAESVGYANQFYFAREFRRLTGVTPSEYRKNPDSGDVFSYRAFLPTLRERLRDHSMDLPANEAIVTVTAPPKPLERRGK